MGGRTLTLLRIALSLLVIGAVSYALWRNWDAVSVHLSKVGVPVVLAALAGTLLSAISAMLGWRMLLADLGTRLRLAEASGIFFIGQLGKYVPGSVWAVLAQAEMGAKLAVPRRRSAVVGLVFIAMAALTGGFMGLPAVPVLLTETGGRVPLWLIAVVAVVAVAVLSPWVLNRGIAIGLRVLRREPLEHALTARAVLGSTAFFAGSWTLFGLSVWALAHEIGPPTGRVTHLALVMICGYALAGLLGMVSFILPAGVGVRDGVLVLLLGTVMPVPAATAVVLLARFASIVADVLLALFAWLWGRAHHLLPEGGPGTAPVGSRP